MATNLQKIRLGAVDAQVLDQGLSTQVDLGATDSGAMFTYKPTYLSVEIDQALAGVAAFRTKEELDYETNLPQASVALFLAAASYPSSGITTTASGTLGTATAPTLTVNGTGAAVTYSYEAVWFDYNGDSIPSTVATTAAGPTTLSAANNITLALAAAPAGAVGTKIIRTAGGGSTGLIAQLPPQATSYTDIGAVATAYVASGVAPATSNADTAVIGSAVAVPIRTLDVAQPKNDLTTNHWLWHVFRAYASDQLQYDFKRDKNAVYKVRMSALADMSVTPSRVWAVTEFY